jgi:aquaporin Z
MMVLAAGRPDGGASGTRFTRQDAANRGIRRGLAGRRLLGKDVRVASKTSRRSGALLSLEAPTEDQFDDPTLEWRRLFSEALGTFFLVLVASGGPVVDAVSHGGVSPSARAVAPGLVVMAVIYSLGAIGGAHLNPAVTLSFAFRRNFPWRRVPGYVLMQLIGAALAASFLRAMFGDRRHVGATLPQHGVGDVKAMVLEALLTLGLVTVILGVASGARNVGPNAALAVGGYIALAGLWAAPITGASMNPARSFGPALVANHWHAFWTYLSGPIGGGLLAVGCAWILRGPPTRAGAQSAQGSLRERRARRRAARN